MKKLGLFVLIGMMGLMGALAHAGTIVQLPLPIALEDVGQSGTKSCVGVKFNADNSVYGQCKTVASSACSGRGCQPVQTTTAYAVTWDATGTEVLAEVACSVTRHHLPQPNTTTYAPGFDATSCPGVVLNSTGTTVGIPYGPYAWQLAYYYYVTTDAVTGGELLNSNVWGFLYLP